jgi:hypothetical protein
MVAVSAVIHRPWHLLFEEEGGDTTMDPPRLELSAA